MAWDIGGKMAGYSPMHISGVETGLVQSRENFLLPDDAYPILTNAYVWRERILRKNAYKLLGRLQRNYTNLLLLNTVGSQTTYLLNLPVFLGISVSEPNFSFVPGTVNLTITGADAATFTDNGNGTFTVTGKGDPTSSVNYSTGVVTLKITSSTGGNPISISFGYYPGLPGMGVRTKDNQNAILDTTVFFDTKYAYVYNGTSFQEFITGTTWSGANYEFFWTTNYWISSTNLKIFWATNYSNSGDPIRYTDGNVWINFAPQINSSGDSLWQCLALIPFRGRLVAFNTSEGGLSPGLRYTNRIRWAAIGNPFTTVSAIVTIVNPNAWRDDIRGQGGFLDIPTNEDIVSVGFVRDNLVIYCENSTWQLRYTGRTIAPFQIEKVNSELGSSGTFSSVQFDTSLLTIGPRGIVECDSFKSTVIDIKIPDFVFNQLSNSNNGQNRVHGIRDFERRLSYWTYNSTNNPDGTFPNSRLIYNYENSSWAIFTDSLTALGTFQLTQSPRWIDIDKPWIECNFPWIWEQSGEPVIVGENQQGFVEILDQYTTNDPSLLITAITANITTSTSVTSPNHNLMTGNVIQITGIPTGTPFDNLNNGIFGVVVPDNNTLLLNIFDPISGQFSTPQLDNTTGYIGGGVISVRDNFNIVSKKFNFINEGQNIQLGYLDILMDGSQPDNPGAITLNIYLDYNDEEPINTYLENNDSFFNSIIPTSPSTLNNVGGSKFWQRVICPVRGNFITLEYTFSNAQMAGIEQTLDVQIDAQVLWVRKAGRLTQI